MRNLTVFSALIVLLVCGARNRKEHDPQHKDGLHYSHGKPQLD